MKKLLTWGLCMVMLFGMSGCGSDGKKSSGDKPEKVVIGTQEMPNDEGIAKAKKYFEEEMGVEVEFKTFDSGRDVAMALMTEDIDFGLPGSTGAALAIAQGAKVEYIWTHEILDTVEELIVKDGIKNAQDLKGKTVATPFASTAHFSLLKYLEKNGVAASDVNILDMQTAEIYTAWESGQIDAAYIWEPTKSKMSSATTLVSSGQMADMGYMTANVELVTSSFAKAYPDMVTAYCRALNKSVQMYNDKNDEAVKTIASYMGLSEKDAKFQMSGSKWLTATEQITPEYMGTPEKKGAIVKNLYEMAQFLKKQGSISEVPEERVFEDAVNPSYAQAAAQGK